MQVCLAAAPAAALCARHGAPEGWLQQGGQRHPPQLRPCQAGGSRAQGPAGPDHLQGGGASGEPRCPWRPPPPSPPLPPFAMAKATTPTSSTALTHHHPHPGHSVQPCPAPLGGLIPTPHPHPLPDGCRTGTTPWSRGVQLLLQGSPVPARVRHASLPAPGCRPGRGSCALQAAWAAALGWQAPHTCAPIAACRGPRPPCLPMTAHLDAPHASSTHNRTVAAINPLPWGVDGAGPTPRGIAEPAVDTVAGSQKQLTLKVGPAWGPDLPPSPPPHTPTIPSPAAPPPAAWPAGVGGVRQCALHLRRRAHCVPLDHDVPEPLAHLCPGQPRADGNQVQLAADGTPGPAGEGGTAQHVCVCGGGGGGEEPCPHPQTMSRQQPAGTDPLGGPCPCLPAWLCSTRVMSCTACRLRQAASHQAPARRSRCALLPRRWVVGAGGGGGAWAHEAGAVAAMPPGCPVVTPSGCPADYGAATCLQVEDCSRVLVCDIPHLDASCSALERPVSGKVSCAALRCGCASCSRPPHHPRCARPPVPVLPRARDASEGALTGCHACLRSPGRCCAPGVTLSCRRATTSPAAGGRPR